MEYLVKSAVLSDCAQYRFSLTSLWDETKPRCTFIGLNPSTADAQLDDPTIRRCVSFAASWGCGELVMVNLHPVRSTDPVMIYQTEKWMRDDIVGKNLGIVDLAICSSKYSIAAWGNHGEYLSAGDAMLRRYKPYLSYLKLNKQSGQPSHPLYLPSDLLPTPYIGATL